MRYGASLIYFLLCAHVGNEVRDGRVLGHAGRGFGGGELAAGGCAVGLVRLGAGSINFLLCAHVGRRGLSFFIFSFMRGELVWGRARTDGPLGPSEHPLHLDVRTLGAPCMFLH